MEYLPGGSRRTDNGTDMLMVDSNGDISVRFLIRSEDSGFVIEEAYAWIDIAR
jgi:hypothetical protein